MSICYARIGAGDPVLVIPGSHADLRRPPTALDAPLVSAFDVITYDQCGLGQSDKPDGSYSMAAYASDAACLIEALAGGRAHVIGISFGGMVAQELAIRYAQRVRKLILCCSSPGGAGGSSYPIHTLQSLSARQYARHMIPIWDRRRDAVWASAHPEQFDEVLRAALATPFSRGPEYQRGQMMQLAARAAHDAWDRLQTILAPTLVCGGRYDGVAPPAIQERIAARIPGARLRLFEGGHLFMRDDPAAYPAMMEFLGVPPTQFAAINS